MTITRPDEPVMNSPARQLRHFIRHYVSGAWGLIAVAAIALVTGLALNWSWLVAAGIAPLILGLLPCAVMCALGLCAMKLIGNSSARQSSSNATPEPDTSSSGRGSPEH